MNPALWDFQDERGHGLSSTGVINVVNRRIYIDDIPIERFLIPYAGKPCNFEFVFLPELEHTYAIDAGIRPLVDVIRSLGYVTLASCEGHLEERYGQRMTHPQVSIAGRFDSSSPEWESCYDSERDVTVLRTVGDATNASQLKCLHDSIVTFTETLSRS